MAGRASYLGSWLAIALLAALCVSCGVKGPPLPPESNPSPEPSPTATPVVKKQR